MPVIQPKDLQKFRALINELRPLTVHPRWKATGVTRKKTSTRVSRKSKSRKKSGGTSG